MKNNRSIATRVALLGVALFSPRLDAQGVAAEPLQVQEIRCSGNTSTSCNFIRDHLYLRVGDALDEEEIRNAELRLSALRNFESVNIRLEKGLERGAVVVVIDVDEASPIAMEWIVGGSSRLESQRAVVGARIAHQNLFGAGKFADFSAIAAIPTGGDGHYESYDIALRYADPQLFDSRRWFGIAEAGYHKRDTQDIYGNYSHLDTAQFDLDVGRRFGDFSYFKVGISWRPDLEWTRGRWKSDGSFLISTPDYEFTTNLVFGWSTEDDLHFPTQGTTLQLAAGGDYGSSSPSRQPHVQLRKTWNWLDSYWTFKIGGDPSPEYRNSFDESQLVALTYARPIRGGDNVRRGRWYIEPGLGGAGNLTAEGDEIYEAGLKVGYRADTRLFGIVDFYLIATVDPER